MKRFARSFMLAAIMLGIGMTVGNAATLGPNPTAAWNQMMDQYIGKIMKRLEDEGLADNTVVIFIGDHGRCHVRGKQWIYDAGIAIPMIVRWPGKLRPGQVCDDLVSGIDIAPTLLKLAGINRTRMENLFHRLFASARLNITINDRFGHPVQPQEWFLVPLFVVDEAVERIKGGTITNYVYDPKAARLVKAVSASRAKDDKSG